MARCGCAGASCSCIITGSGGVSVTGAGSTGNPYLITSDINLSVVDSPTVNLTLDGDGSDGSPWLLSAAATVTLDDLTDVSTAVTTTGYVVARQGDGTFAMVPPNTAGPGVINVGDGLTGDGSSGNKLRVLLAPSSGLVVGPTGLSIQGGGVWSTYVPVWSCSTTAPTLGNGSIEGYYSQVGKTVHVAIEMTVGSTTKRGVGYYRWTLPVPPATNRRQALPGLVSRAGISTYILVANVWAGRVDSIQIATGTTATPVSHSNPATLPTGSLISFNGSYEAA